MIKYKRYERYKDSGVEWIGEIPEHWELRKIKHIGMLSAGGVNKKIEEGEELFKSVHYMDVYRNSGKAIGNDDDYLVVSATQSQAKNCTLRKGDVLFTSSSETPDDIGHAVVISEDLEQTLYGYHLIRLRLDRDIPADYSYRKYMFNNHYIRSYFSSRTQGITRYGLKYDDYKEAVVFIPPISEQKTIANFLDQKTAVIDGLIADKEKLIELLQEKRQAIITEAVTKGLNPNVRMKDSGIEWIGEIPEHWEVKKLKHVSNITMGQSPKSEECSYDEIGVPFLQGNAEFTNVHPIPKMYCNTANKFSKVNDILLSVRAPVGAINISDRVYGIGRGLCAITAKKVIMKYLWYSLNVSLEELFIKSKGSTFEAVTVTDVQNLLIILPPKNEQDDIVNFLDKKTAEIDGLVIEIKKQIEKLKEYRQSLISEAVTGKIYVRDYAID